MTEEVKAFKQGMLCHHPNATPAEESIAWKLWQSAWSEAPRARKCPRGCPYPEACAADGGA